jgi:hypothetical protein
MMPIKIDVDAVPKDKRTHPDYLGFNVLGGRPCPRLVRTKPKSKHLLSPNPARRERGGWGRGTPHSLSREIAICKKSGKHPLRIRRHSNGSDNLGWLGRRGVLPQPRKLRLLLHRLLHFS